MLDHLRQKAAQAFASASSMTLSSYGPAGIQSSRVTYQAQDLSLYVFLPPSSDHLLNLEQRPGIVAAATDAWDLQGNARVLSRAEIPAGIQRTGIGQEPNQPALDPMLTWGWAIIEIRPTRLTLHAPIGMGNIETIDF
jgi:hypothetical protein